ncbi:MAG: hypothetical protein IT357_15770 [Gemmatimonadaceae bacterium]|nr:hypothetical protein [Gemmatimonadaceae bacterium]
MLRILPLRRPITRIRAAWAAAFGLVGLCACAELGAQAIVVDAGTFSLEVSGQRVGREDFSIRRAPAGALATFVAQGNVVKGGLRYSVVLNTDSMGVPQTFRLQTLSAGKELETVTGEWRRGLWSGRSESAIGESAREFRLPESTVALADEVVHQIWFVLRGGPDRPVQVLLPRRLELRSAWVEAVGTERMAIGLREFDAQHWIIRESRGGLVLQEAWTDAAGRLLRVRVPSESLEALRDEAPSETVVRP